MLRKTWICFKQSLANICQTVLSNVFCHTQLCMMDTYCDACLKSLTTQHFYSYNGYVLIMSNVNGVLEPTEGYRPTAPLPSAQRRVSASFSSLSGFTTNNFTVLVHTTLISAISKCSRQFSVKAHINPWHYLPNTKRHRNEAASWWRF